MRWALIAMLLLAPLASAMEVKGVSLAHLHRRGFGYGSDECAGELKQIKSLGANWVALNDFAYMQSVNAPRLVFERDGSMTRADLVKTVRDAHAVGLKVLIKPHIWSREFWRGGKWVGDIRMNSEEDWQRWFADYTAYVLYNAEIAAETGADGLSIGVELEGTSHRADDWRRLIEAVRKAYKGPITYCAAFREWQKIEWWDGVDVMGVTAYFPLAQGDSPDDAAIRAGWAKVYDELSTASRKWGKRICFAEIGYTQSATAAAEPWSGEVARRDADLQARLYRIALEEARKRDFMVGVFVWKWFTSDRWAQMERHDAFALQGQSEALDAIRTAWGASGPGAK